MSGESRSVGRGSATREGRAPLAWERERERGDGANVGLRD